MIANNFLMRDVRAIQERICRMQHLKTHSLSVSPMRRRDEGFQDCIKLLTNYVPSLSNLSDRRRVDVPATHQRSETQCISFSQAVRPSPPQRL
jgi:hypothetical protein